MFCRNVGGLDRAVRLVLGAILLPVGLFLLASGHGNGVTITVLGVAGLATGITGFCPPYMLFGFSTARPGRPPGSEGGERETQTGER